MATDVPLTPKVSTPRAAVSPAGHSANHWLIWKEIRQLKPLLVLLVSLTLAMIVFQQVVELLATSQPPNFSGHLILLMPMLFAVGAGPMLVSQEWSTKSMSWLRTLPISANRIITTKWLVGLISLVAIWIISLTTAALTGVTFTEQVQQSAMQTTESFVADLYRSNVVQLLLVGSLYLLTSGYFVGWWIRDQVLTLVALIAAIFFPIVVWAITQAIFDPNEGQEPSATSLLAMLIGATVIATGLMYGLGVRALNPLGAPRFGLASENAAAVPHATTVAATPRFGSSFVAMVWQIIWGARLKYAIVVGALGLAILLQYSSAQGARAFGVMIAGLSFFGLASLSFQGTSGRQSIRFLSQRGVSPLQAYAAIHSVPMAIICTSFLGYSLWYASSPAQWGASASPIAMLALVLTAYGMCQWFSQFSSNLFISSIGGPIIAFLLTISLIFMPQVGTPFVVVGLLAVLPYLATAMMMRRFMDGGDRKLSTVLLCSFAVLIFLVPTGFAINAVRSAPRMTDAERLSFIENGQREFRRRRSHKQLVPMSVMAPRDTDQDSLNGAPRGDRVSAYALRADLQIPNDHALLSDSGLYRSSTFSYAQPNTSRTSVVQSWLDICGHKITAYLSAPADQNWDELKPWVVGSGRMIGGLRRSDMLQSQADADALSALWVLALQEPEFDSRRQTQEIAELVEAIGTRRSRAQARKHALYCQFHKSLGGQDQFLGGRDRLFPTPSLENYPAELIHWVQPRLQQFMYKELLQKITAAENNQPFQPNPERTTSQDTDFWRLSSLWGGQWESLSPATRVAH